MSNLGDHMETTPAHSEALRQNPGVDPKVLAEAERLRLELERLGVARISSYDLAPALGGSVIRNAERQSERPSRPPAEPAEERLKASAPSPAAPTTGRSA